MSADNKRRVKNSLAGCVATLEDTNTKLQEKVDKLQDQLTQLVEFVGNIKAELKVERVKSHLFAELLRQHTEIKVDSLIKEREGELHVYNYPDGKVSVIVHDYLRNKKKQYTLNQPTLEDEESCFAEVENSRSYNKAIKSLQKIRSEKKTMDEYINTMENHKIRLNQLFQNKYDHKKAEGLLGKSFNSLEQRLLRIGKYYNVGLETDDIMHYKQLLTGESFYNYSLALFPLSELIEPYIKHKNIIYLPNEKSSENDPFSFYIKSKTNKWKLEVRLYDLSKVIAHDILEYGIRTFRNVYMDMFHDNTYREDMGSIWLQQDGEQLLMNLALLSQPKKWCKLLQDTVMRVATYEETEDDEFDFRVDERLNRRQFQGDTDTPEQIVEMAQRLFDDISEEDARAWISKRMKW